MELTQAPGLQSSCPVIMEDSIDSMSDNGCDNGTPLKQVVELCSLLAGKGLQFSISVRIKNSFVFSLKSEKSGPSQGTRRSPSYVRRQERRKLLRKKTDSFPEKPMEPREINNDCSLDLSPNPDSGLLGNREVSEEESSSAESENESEKEDGSGWSKHIIRVRRNFFNPRMETIANLFTNVTVYARDDVALADIDRAIHRHDFSKIQQIQGLRATCEYSCDGNFQNYIPPIEASRYIVK